jgi:hypothetical protein
MKKLTLLGIILGLSVGAHAVVADTYYDGTTVVGDTTKGVIKIKGGNDMYIVAAKADDQIYDVQMTFGERAVARFHKMPGQQVTVDVYRLEALGTFDGTKFRPCEPGAVDEPDCTPTRFPPRLPGRGLQLQAFLGL